MKTRVIMDYYPEKDLFERQIARPLIESEAVHVFKQVLAALKILHRMGGIHRNLKPESIFLDRDHDGILRVHLASFEYTKFPGILENGAALGTPLIYSPEYARALISRDKKGKEVAAGPSSDIWALGVLAYFLFYPSNAPFWVHAGYRPETQVLQLAHLDALPLFPPGNLHEAFVSQFLKLEPRPSLDEVIALFQAHFRVNVA